MAIRILIAEDHTMVRQALAVLLAAEADMEVVGEAADGPAAADLADTLRPDVLIVDVALPGISGIEVTRRVRKSCPEIRVIALSAYAYQRFVQEVLAVGGAGYVNKSAAVRELVTAVRAVAAGNRYLCPDSMNLLVNGFAARGSDVPPPASVLGRRERQVLSLLAEGRRSPAIARELRVAESTIMAHRRNINRKLGLRTVAELTRYAIREGLVEP